MFDFVTPYLPLFLEGFVLTVEITLFGIFAGLGIGTLAAIGDIYGGKFASTIIRIYVEFFRGSALFAQLFIAEYAVPALIHIRIDPYVTAFAVFALNSAAYQKGYIKGAMETVFLDQMQAGLSTGMSKVQTIRHVILPQSLRIVIPAWSNEFCSLTKSTSTLAFVGLFDLVAAGRTVIGLTYIVLPTWALIAAVYFVWITGVTKILDIIYEKKKIPGIEISI